MSVIDKISKLVANQFPSFYKEEGDKFLAFIEAYYEYMEQNGKMTDAIRNLESYHDIQETTDDFIQYFINTFLPSVPVNVAADKKLLVRYINEANRTRGTRASYKLFFRALYNEDIEINFPADQILKVSDGDWRKDRYLVIPFNQEAYEFIGKTILGADSGTTALVEDIVRRNIRGRDIMQILLSNIVGEFNHLEPIRLSETSSIGHPYTPIAEAGIQNIEIISPGGEYKQGDVVDVISDLNGLHGKIVVTDTVNLGGTLTFDLQDGGSGYTASTSEGGTEIEFTGGDGSDPASFRIEYNDIVDTFAIAINTNLISSNNIFGSKGPMVTYSDSSTGIMDTFANTLLSSPDYGFPENGEESNNKNFYDQVDAEINIANTSDIIVGDSLYGESSGANATVIAITDSTANNSWFRVDGYKKFSASETVKIGTAGGSAVGTVIEFQSNTIGTHVVEVCYNGNTAITTLQKDDEIVGLQSNSFGVIKNVLETVANGCTYGAGGADDKDLIRIKVSANTTSNLTSQWEGSGPLIPFIENEGLRLVGSGSVIGNVVSTTSNTEIENTYTLLKDALNFEATTFGTISRLSLPVGGSGYSVAPTIKVRENDIAALGIGEQYITLQSDDLNWGTGNSSFTALDTNDKLSQANTGASGDVKAGFAPNQQVSVIYHANGTYEMTVRVWQEFLQREPGNIKFANNQFVDLEIYDSSYVVGEGDTRTPTDHGTAKIVGIQDEGVLGDNAKIKAGVGANGTITGIRVVDSGFCYRDKEIVILETPKRNLGTSSSIKLSLGGVANSEGYYATSRSHLDTLRGYIQDSHYYQEYSYEVISPIALDRYRDYALKLVHPAGQALFGKYRSQSNANIEVTANTSYQKHIHSNGTISINNGSFDIVGSSTSFTSEFANNDTIIIEYGHKQFYKIPINIVSDDTTANLTIAWANTNLSDANAYYISGSFNGNV